MKKKLKVLILIDWFLPGNKAGGPVKSIYSLVKSLSHQIDFYVVTFNTDILSEKQYNVQANCWTKCNGIDIYYFSHKNFSFRSLVKVLHSVNPDILYINSFWSYRCSILPLVLKKIRKINYPIILSPRGMLISGALEIKSFKKKIFLWLSKILGLHHSIIFHSTSIEEFNSIKRLFPHQKIFNIPNLSYIQYDYQSITKSIGQLRLFFLSRISPIKNLDFAIKILNTLSLTSDQKIEMDIYGNNEDKEYFKYCKDLMKNLPENIIVKYKGTLSFEEVGKVIPQYHALFLPTKNENFGHSIVETMMCERPVLISDQTPWNDVEQYQAGFALPLNEDLFKDKIIQLLQLNNKDFQTMCKNARNYIQQKLDTQKIISEYIKMFEYAAQQKS